MKYLVVDDEKYARLRLIRLLKKIEEDAIIDEAENAEVAMTFIENDKPDLLFLDINMPRVSGIDFLTKLQNPPYTIFVTAHSEHAVDAFDLNAIDFLLKPYNEERFFQSIKKAKLFLQDIHQKSISIKDGSKTYMIYQNEIMFIQSEGNYIKIVKENESLLVRQTLRSIQKMLSENDFIKINRSTIINRNQISEIKSASHGDRHVFLKSNHEFKISRTHKIDI